jgi:hypothetical protein
MITREHFTFVRLLLAILLMGFSMFFLPILEPLFLGVVYTTTAAFELGRDVLGVTHVPDNPYGWSGLGAAYQMILDRGYDGHLSNWAQALFWLAAIATLAWQWSAALVVIIFFGGVLAGAM